MRSKDKAYVDAHGYAFKIRARCTCGQAVNTPTKSCIEGYVCEHERVKVVHVPGYKSSVGSSAGSNQNALMDPQCCDPGLSAEKRPIMVDKEEKEKDARLMMYYMHFKPWRWKIMDKKRELCTSASP